MKHTMLFIASSFLGPALLGHEVKMRVVDDQNEVVADADATIEFVGYTQQSSKAYRGKTDNRGEFRATGVAQDSVFIVADKAGYYQTRMGRLPKGTDIEKTIVLPRVLHPVALYVNRFNLGSGRGITIPVQNEWLGFDFEIGDWVTPYGRGKTADIDLKFRNEFIGWKQSEDEMMRSRRINSDLSETELKKLYGKWNASLEISFPGTMEGIHEETRFLAYSRMKLPHSAPEDGYLPTWHYSADSYSPRNVRDNVGFFLRTRVKLDNDGKIISANYAKLIGDIELVATGYLMFWYYYNPVPNDRNLEFDPTKNLFPASMPGANVVDP